MKEIHRCKWAENVSHVYKLYHDKEWSVEEHNDSKLFEMLILESLQAGLSWQCILNKRESIRKAFANFNANKIANFTEEDINKLMNNAAIIRNKLKIEAVINNSKIFLKIQKEFNSFDNYIWSFTNREIVYEPYYKRTFSTLSETISKDLKKRGMKFVGKVIIYSYLQAIGIINGHGEECYKFEK